MNNHTKSVTDHVLRVVERGRAFNHTGIAIVAVWTSVALLLAGQAWFAAQVRGEPIAWSRVTIIWLVWAAAWAAITPIALRLAAQFPFRRGRLMPALAIHTAASAVCAVANLALFALAAPLIGASNAEPTWLATFNRLIGTTFLLNLPLYWVIVAAAQVERIVRTAREKDRRQLMLEAQLADARLQTLRAQLQPHFLFNALNTVSVLMHEDVESADHVLLQLAALLRRSLDSGEVYEVTLGEELGFLENYLAIEQARFGPRLSWRMAVPDELFTARVPNLILQPLVENALRHGLAARAGPCRIETSAARRGESLELCVYDNGGGLSPTATERVGLSNTRARLRLLYDDHQRFELRNAPNGGVIAAITLPLRVSQ